MDERKTIYLDDAMDALRKAMHADIDHMAAIICDGIEDELNSLPSAQQWIPCSERLPECEQEVLICTEKKVYVSKKTGMEW